MITSVVTSPNKETINYFIKTEKKNRLSFGTHFKIGTIQRRLAWPLRKDDIQIREIQNFFFRFETASVNRPVNIQFSGNLRIFLDDVKLL
jgi:hypothetical protein